MIGVLSKIDARVSHSFKRIRLEKKLYCTLVQIDFVNKSAKTNVKSSHNIVVCIIFNWSQ